MSSLTVAKKKFMEVLCQASGSADLRAGHAYTLENTCWHVDNDHQESAQSQLQLRPGLAIPVRNEWRRAVIAEHGPNSTQRIFPAPMAQGDIERGFLLYIPHADDGLVSLPGD